MCRFVRFLEASVSFNGKLMLLCLGFHSIKYKYKQGAVSLKSLKQHLIVANHIATVDAVILETEKLISLVVKSELVQVPILSTVLIGIGCIAVDRHSKKGREDALSQIKTFVNTNPDRNVLIFPEGTTHNNRLQKKIMFFLGKTVQDG